LQLSEQLEQIGGARNDAAAQSLGYAWQGTDHFFLGEFVTARALLERGLVDPAQQVIKGLAYDPYAGPLAFLAWTLACLGYIDQARSRMDETLSEARRHVHALVHGLAAATFVDYLTSSPMVHTEELLALVTEHHFPFVTSQPTLPPQPIDKQRFLGEAILGVTAVSNPAHVTAKAAILRYK
jgi:hypothetical protein